MIQRNRSSGQFFFSPIERFGHNLTVTICDISKLTHFPPEYYVSLLLYNPLVVYQKEQLFESLLGWKSCSKKQRWTCISVANTLYHITIH